jgi:RsiW-degrading membrane proteinase PrsW (M82 family)
MLTNEFWLYVFSAVLAFIPALIWLGFLLKDHKAKKYQVMIFILSVFTVVPVFLLHYLLNIFPQFDIVHFFEARIEDQNINFLILFIFVGIVEEIVKQAYLRFIDNKYLLIHTINDSIRYSLVAALGFSFAENIFYIFTIYTSLGVQQLIIAYLFRSIFTTTAHLMFSGFFGYYYGIAKFSINIVEQNKMLGEKNRLANFFARFLNMSRIQAFQEMTILKGLFIAIVMHAIFNFLLQLNIILPVVIFVIVGFGILQYLLKRRTGALVLVTDVSQQQASSMARNDEEVVLELMGMWFNQKKYVDVLHICERLLERDPDNQVVQLFKTKALDKLDPESPYNKIFKNIFPAKQQEESIFTKYKPASIPASSIAAKNALPTKENAIEKNIESSNTPDPKNDSNYYNLNM